MTDLQWHNETRKIADLVPANYNPRKLSPEGRKDLEASITGFGTVEPVVVNVGARANVLIAGHQRVVIYADLGIETVDVRVPSRELSADEELRLNLRLNKNTGHFDNEKLLDLPLDVLKEVGFKDHDLLFFNPVKLPKPKTFRKMTFTLAPQQMEFIKKQVELVTEFPEKFGNESAAGNALYTLIKRVAK